MNKLIYLLPLLLLASCDTVPQSYESHPNNASGIPAYSEFVTEVEGCKIFKVAFAGSGGLYMSKCDHSSAVSNSYNQGKSHVTNNNVTVDPHKGGTEADELQVLEAADKIRLRNAALDKLTPQEKAALGYSE